MRQQHAASYLLIAFSFLIGIVLTIVPMPQWAIWARPQWVFALLLFWVLAAPLQCGIGIAWLVGVLMSLITGTPFGEQSIVFVLLIYVLLKIYPIVAHLPLWQQAGAIGLFAGCNALLQGFILGFTGHSTHIELFELSALTTALIWPIMAGVLNRFRPKVYIR